MRKPFPVILLFLLWALPPARADRPPAVTLRWPAEAASAVRRELVERLLEGGAVRALLDDGTELAGTVVDVDADTFTIQGSLEGDAAGRATLPCSRVRGLDWEKRPESRARKAKTAAALFAGQGPVEVRLRGGRAAKGSIREAGDLALLLVAPDGSQRSIDYREVERIPKPPRMVLEEIGGVALLVLLAPLVVVAAILTGWDGC